MPNRDPPPNSDLPAAPLRAGAERASASDTEALARLRELRADLEEAEVLRDVGRAERLTHAIEQLTEEAEGPRGIMEGSAMSTPNTLIPAKNGGDGWESNPPRTLSALIRF